jgi:hypothetical protein
VLDGTFLEGVDASKRRWHEPSAQQKGILPAYRWTGPGRDGLEVAYGKAESRPNAATVREVWKQRHGYRAAPLLLVVTYPDGQRHRAVLCGPAGDDPRVVEIDYEQAERMAAAALGEQDCHLAIRFLSEALEGEPDEHPGLRNKGLFATHPLLIPTSTERVSLPSGREVALPETTPRSPSGRASSRGAPTAASRSSICTGRSSYSGILSTRAT